MQKLLDDKEIDVKRFLAQGKPYTENASECSASKVTVSQIKAKYKPSRPCNEIGVQRYKKKPGCSSACTTSDIGCN
jgi:DNA invertase Pin-like site-specific DNA recombinase